MGTTDPVRPFGFTCQHGRQFIRYDYDVRGNFMYLRDSGDGNQGIGVVTGLQKSFDWRGVVASGIGAGVGQAIGGALGPNVPADGMGPVQPAAFSEYGAVGDFARAGITSFGAGLATAVARGGRVAVTQIATDAFGQALGQSLAGASSSGNAYSESAMSAREDARDAAVAQVLGIGGNSASGQYSGLGGVDPIGQAYDYMQDHPQSGVPFREVVDFYGGRAESGYLPSLIPDATRVGFNSRAGEIWSTDANTYPVQQSGITGTDLAPLAVEGTGLLAGGRASMNDYWSRVAADGVSEGSFLKYSVGRTMQWAGNVGYSLADMGVAAYNSPEQSFAGGLKSIANFGPEAFNGTANLVKTSLNGYSLFAEKLGAGDGAFAGFRGSDAYNITPLFNYENQAQAGGALLTQVALGAGLSKFGGYSLELNASTPGVLYSNPFQLKLSPRTTPGVVTFGDDLVVASGRWLDASVPAPIPLQVARQLEGQTFNRFDNLRNAVWRTVAADPELRSGFNRASLAQMREGNAPFAPLTYQTNSSGVGVRFNLHHVEPVALGGSVYNLSNIQIVSPKVHFGLHY